MAPRPTRASHLDNEQCRQCSSFADYLKENRKKINKDAENGEMCMAGDEPSKPSREDCPLDKDQLGTRTWGLLHTIAAKYPVKPTNDQKRDICSFFKVFSKLYPCDHCAAELREDLLKNPAKNESQHTLSQWLCELHNRVNAKTGKPQFDCLLVNERWRDGWKDGSCDY